MARNRKRGGHLGLPKSVGNVSSYAIAHLNDNRSQIDAREKVRRINDALHANDMDALRSLAISSRGLINKDLRAVAWPKLLGANVKGAAYYADIVADNEYSRQIKLDVDRSLFRYPKGIRESERRSLRIKLDRIMNGIICTYPHLHYYQGFHDICSVLLIVAGEAAAFAMLEVLCHAHLRDFMGRSLDGATRQLSLLLPLIQCQDPRLADHIMSSGIPPHFALSWVITWYSHVVEDMDTLERLFDVFIASHPLVPIYVAAALVIHRRSDVLAAEAEFSEMHGLLSKMPKSFPAETLIAKAKEFFAAHPPAALLAANQVKGSLAVSGYKSLQKDGSASLLKDKGSSASEGNYVHIAREDVPPVRHRRGAKKATNSPTPQSSSLTWPHLPSSIAKAMPLSKAVVVGVSAAVWGAAVYLLGDGQSWLW
eukprot:Opistho-2@46346